MTSSLNQHHAFKGQSKGLYDETTLGSQINAYNPVMQQPMQQYSHHFSNGSQTSQGLRMNSKSPGRGNFAPMNYSKQNTGGVVNNSATGEAYNYSIPSDTFYPMIQMGAGGGMAGNFNSAKSNQLIH